MAEGSIQGNTPPRTLAEKLEHLFRTVHPRGREYSNNEVAAAIGVSGTYIGQLRKGLRNNPTKETIEGIANFFGVDPAYFFDDEVTDQWDKRLQLLVRLRDAGATSVAARLVGLSPDMLEVADTFLQQLEAVEGLRKDATQPPSEDDRLQTAAAEPEVDG